MLLKLLGTNSYATVPRNTLPYHRRIGPPVLRSDHPRPRDQIIQKHGQHLIDRLVSRAATRTAWRFAEMQMVDAVLLDPTPMGELLQRLAQLDVLDHRLHIKKELGLVDAAILGRSNPEPLAIVGAEP